MIKLKDILNETQSKQNLNEGKMADNIRAIVNSAKAAAEKDFDKYKEFLNLDAIAKDKPQLSVDKIAADVSNKFSQQSEGILDEGIRDFIVKIANKIDDFIDIDALKVLGGFSNFITGLISFAAYSRYVRLGEFVEFYNKNMPADGMVLIRTPMRFGSRTELIPFPELLDRYGNSEPVYKFLFGLFTIVFITTLIIVAVKLIARGVIAVDRIAKGRTKSGTAERTIYTLKMIFNNKSLYKFEQQPDDSVKLTFLKNSKFKNPELFAKELSMVHGYKIKSTDPLTVVDKYFKTLKFTQSPDKTFYTIEVI